MLSNSKGVHLPPLKIALEVDKNEKTYVDSYQGAYPVIYMTWKDVKPMNFLDAKRLLAAQIY